MINVGMVAGARIASFAAENGAQQVNRTNAVWLPLLFAGFIATAAYCALLLTKRGRWRQFWAPRTTFYWGLALIMALCWFGSVELYGIGAAKLGQAGPVLGWPVFLSSSIVTANVWGAATGEWLPLGRARKEAHVRRHRRSDDGDVHHRHCTRLF